MYATIYRPDSKQLGPDKMIMKGPRLVHRGFEQNSGRATRAGEPNCFGRAIRVVFNSRWSAGFLSASRPIRLDRLTFFQLLFPEVPIRTGCGVGAARIQMYDVIFFVVVSKLKKTLHVHTLTNCNGPRTAAVALPRLCIVCSVLLKDVHWQCGRTPPAGDEGWCFPPCNGGRIPRQRSSPRY